MQDASKMAALEIITMERDLIYLYQTSPPPSLLPPVNHDRVKGQGHDHPVQQFSQTNRHSPVLARRCLMHLPFTPKLPGPEPMSPPNVTCCRPLPHAGESLW